MTGIYTFTQFTCTCLLRGRKAVLGSAEDAADEAQLIKSELGRFRAFFFFEQTADRQNPTVTARPVDGHI